MYAKGAQPAVEGHRGNGAEEFNCSASSNAIKLQCSTHALQAGANGQMNARPASFVCEPGLAQHVRFSALPALALLQRALLYENC